MATNKPINYPVPISLGTEAGPLPALLHFAPSDATGTREPSGYIPRNIMGELFSKNMMPFVGGAFPYTAAHWAVTTTGTAAAVANATSAGGGLLLTAGSTSTFNTNLQSNQLWTPVAGKRVVALARVIVSSITAVGFEFNIGNSQVDPATSEYTDVVGIKMAVGAGTVIGKVRGDSGTIANSATLGTATAATEFFVGFDVSLNASAGSVVGGFFYGTNITTSLAYTSFTANQQTQAAAILTTPPSMFLNLHAKGSAGNPTVTFVSVLAGIDN